MLDFYTNVVGPYWPQERKLVEESYRKIPFPFAEITTPAFRMEERWPLDQLLGYFSTWSATTRYIKATGHNPLEFLREAFSRVWRDTNAARCVAWPLSLRFGGRQS